MGAFLSGELKLWFCTSYLIRKSHSFLEGGYIRGCLGPLAENSTVGGSQIVRGPVLSELFLVEAICLSPLLIYSCTRPTVPPDPGSHSLWATSDSATQIKYLKNYLLLKSTIYVKCLSLSVLFVFRVLNYHRSEVGVTEGATLGGGQSLLVHSLVCVSHPGVCSVWLTI